MISVCLAAYNGEKYIAEQLNSILSQIGEDDEVVVSDDGSTDRTLEVVAQLNDPRIHVVHSTAHRYNKNFQNAMLAAKGDIIFFSDQDDVWLPGKVEACLKALEKVDLVCHNCIVTDCDLKPTNPSFFSFYHSGPGLLKNALKNTYYGNSLAFRRKVMEEALPLPDTGEIGHDLWLGLVAEMIGRVCFIDTPYLLYRRHDDAFSRTGSFAKRSKRPLWVKLWSRVVVLWYLLLFRISHLPNKDK